MRITKKMAKGLIEVLDQVREEVFKGRKKEYPYTEWEQKREKVKERIRNLPEYVKKAVDMIHVDEEKMGRPPILSLEKKVMLFLLARWLNRTNRGMEELLELFTTLFDFDVSYKYVERLYSDEHVQMALHNLFILLVQDEGVSGDLSGDGSGYSLMINKVYKEDPKKNSKKYRYVFRLIDLKTNFYVAYGFSRRSEMDAFRKALEMTQELGIAMDSVSLDKYYSSRKVIKLFGTKVMLYLIPKRNLSKIGCWYRILKRILKDPAAYLQRYFLRNLSETGFSSDKRRFGGFVRQRREDRQETALASIAILHNVHAIRVHPQ